MSDTPSSLSPSPIPLVIQLGFAGVRELYDATVHTKDDAQAIAEKVTEAIKELLEGLQKEMGLETEHEAKQEAKLNYFFCGISQIAIGGDMAFAKALQELKWLHRIFLPQPRDSYLIAEEPGDPPIPDFDEIQRKAAEGYLDQPTIIQTRVVSDAADRDDRFRDVNLEIARVSDVVVCLVRAGHGDKAGGTQEMIRVAKRRGRPVIILEVVADNGHAIVRRPEVESEKAYWEVWRNGKKEPTPELPSVPKLPSALLKAGIPPFTVPPLPVREEYVKHVENLKNVADSKANQLRFSFKKAALIIVLGHVMATVFAACALKMPHHGLGVMLVLVAELLLLGWGLLVHRQMHDDHAIEDWATLRLASEVGRSIWAIGRFPVYLEHFFPLPFPPEFRALLRTLNVLHLHDTRASDMTDWKKDQTAYVERRLSHVDDGQIPYYTKTLVAAEWWLKVARGIFHSCSIGALVATTLKLLCYCLPEAHSCDRSAFMESLPSILGVLAVSLPVIAVAALSLAAAFDQEAKKHTSSEMLVFLEKQLPLLDQAETSREFSRLLIETEYRLLGETVNWYARRTFVGVA